MDGDRLTLRRAKTGKPVFCCLCGPAADALAAIAKPDQKHRFWTGHSRPQTSANFWRTRLHRVVGIAGVEGFKPHRLRDTFAVGVAMDGISVLLGHGSIRTTERNYAPWDLPRSNCLMAIVRDANNRDPVVRWWRRPGNRRGGGW